jgi:hypothetical protein
MTSVRRTSLRLVCLAALALGMAWSQAEPARYENQKNSNNPVEFEGTVTAFLNATDFFIDDSFVVRTSWNTHFSGIEDTGDLGIGDRVRIQGRSEGNTIMADLVKLLDGCDQQAVIDGTVSWVIDAWTFVIDETTEVSIDGETIFEGFSWLGELSAGDPIHVEGWWYDGILVADLVRRTNDPGHAVSLEGDVTQIVSSTDFILDDTVLVMTTMFTEFLGITSVSDLQPGDRVAVVGMLSQDSILADSVELLSGGGPDPEEIQGIVNNIVDGNAFILQGGITIRTDTQTEFFGIDGVWDLQPGDHILAWGWWTEGVFLAQSVQLVQSAPDPVEVTGLLAYLEPPHAFVLDNQTRVEVTGETQWIGLGGYADLVVGDSLRVLGIPDEQHWTLGATEIERLEQSEPTWITREGWVDEVMGPETVLLTDGVTLQIRPDAVLVALDRIEDLGPGDLILIGGYTTADPNILDILRLELRERPGHSVDFVSVIESIDLHWNRFSTANGFEVIVDNTTVFVNVDGLTEMSVGDWVSVMGISGRDPHHPQWVEAVRVEWREGEDDGGGDGDGNGGGLRLTIEGTVTEILPEGVFEIDSGLLISTNDETEWRGALGDLGDLLVDTPIRTEVILQSDGTLVALWIQGYSSIGSGILEIEGYVLEINIPERRLRLESGEWIQWDEFTQIDGDVGSPAEIVPGMHLFVLAVDLGDDAYLSFAVFAEAVIHDVNALGFPDEPTRETLVVLKDGAVASSVASRYGAFVTGTLPGQLVYLFRWPNEIDLSMLQNLLDDEDVEILEPNRSFSDPESDPDSIRRRAIAIDRAASSDKFNNQDAVFKAALDVAHSRTLGQGTLVAVIDTGVDPFHPLLRHRIADGGYDFVDEDPLPWETADGIDQDGDEEIDEGAGHGTFVAGLVLLAAPGTSILPFRVLDDDGRGSTFDISRAVLLAIDRGADVINMSFAYPERSRILDRILMEASNRGVVLVSGAGNSGLSTLPFPATDNRVLAVGAVDGTLRLADFSNHGMDIALGAPGIDLYSAGIENQFGTWSGTSMAAPLVSGTAALMRSINPYLTPRQIGAALIQGATEADPNDDIAYVLHAGNAIELIPDGSK